MKRARKHDAARRALVGVVLALPVVAVVPASAAPQTVPSIPEQSGSGYHVTDHVRTYYRMARY